MLQEPRANPRNRIRQNPNISKRIRAVLQHKASTVFISETGVWADAYKIETEGERARERERERGVLKNLNLLGEK